MKINKDIVRKTAHLARLHLDEGQEQQMVKDLQQMVDWMDKLNEVNTDSVEPLTHMSFEIDSFRDDVADHQLNEGEAFKNAPKHDGRYFQVPKVISK